MNEHVKKRGFSNQPGRHAPDLFRSVLAPIDLTPGSDRVLGRLALLPLADGARLTLLHVVPESLPATQQRRAERDAKKALAEEVRHLAKSLPRAVSITPIVATGAAAKEIAAHASAVKAELIVMGRGGGRAFRDVFLGSTAERVIRRGQLPVLVVRLVPRALYARPALALDLDRAAPSALAVLFRLIRPPRPRVALIHAFDVPFQGLVYPSISQDDVDELRDQFQLKATQELTQLIAASLERAKISPEHAPRWKLDVRCGVPRLVIEKAVKKLDADLLVLGTHGHAGVAHLFLGTVAGEVLRDVACDVLVVPATSRRG